MSAPRDSDDELHGEVRALLRAGLPVQARWCGPGLLELRGVTARALHPDDRSSRVRALDALLRAQLDRLENGELAEAARLLFGAQHSTSGATLTERRTAAAAAAGYEVHHFRKRIEPKLLELVAWQLRRDSEDFAASRAQPPELRAATHPLVVPADVFAWEAADHQQALAELWGAVYQLRAQLIDVARTVSMDASDPGLNTTADQALWRYALVLSASAAYRAAYGAVLLQAPTGLGPADVAAYAGWTPDFTPTQELMLATLANPLTGFSAFVTRLHLADGGAGLVDTWRSALTGRPGQEGSIP